MEQRKHKIILLIVSQIIWTHIKRTQQEQHLYYVLFLTETNFFANLKIKNECRKHILKMDSIRNGRFYSEQISRFQFFLFSGSFLGN